MNYSIVSMALGIVPVTFLAVIWEWVLFQRVMEDRVEWKWASLAAAYLTASLLVALQTTDRGGFILWALLMYLPGAGILALALHFRGDTIRRNADERERANAQSFSETFD